MNCSIYVRTKASPVVFEIRNLEGLVMSTADGKSGGGMEVEMVKPIPIIKDMLYIFKGDTQLQVLGKDILAILIN